MPTLPQEFVKVFAQRLADYSGRDHSEVRAVVRQAGDDLPVRIADLMLDDTRVHAENRRDPQHARNQVEYQSARRRLVDLMHGQLARVTTDGHGTLVQRQQQARTDAETVFARAVDVVDPVAVGLGVPRALEQQRAPRIEAALDTLRGVPGHLLPDPETVGRWLTSAERLAEAGREDVRPGDREQLVAYVDRILRRSAGDQEYEPMVSTRSADETMRDGLAVAWARSSRAEFAETLGVADVLAGPDVTLADRFEGRMADGLAQGIAERTGRSPRDVLERLVEAGRTGNRDQWSAAARLLAPEEPPQRLEGVDRSYPRYVVAQDMRRVFTQSYGNSDVMPDITPEEVGAKIAEAGGRAATDLGVAPESGIARDPGLDTAFKAAGMPPGGGRQPVAGSSGSRPETTARPSSRDQAGRQVSGGR